MADLSPVLKAYFGGQSNQGDFVKMALDQVNKKRDSEDKQKHLDYLVKALDQEEKFRTMEHDIHAQQVKLESDKAHASVRQQLLQNLSSGLQAPQGLNIPGMNAGPVPVPEQQVNNPTQTSNTEFGPMTVPMPKTANQMAAEKITAEGAARMPFDMAKMQQLYENALGKIQATADSKINGLTMQLTNAKDIADFRVNAMRDIATDRNASAESRAQMNATTRMAQQMMGMGLPPDSETLQKVVAQHAIDSAMGREDLKDIKGTPLHNYVQNYKRNAGLVDLPEGTKTRAKIMEHANTAADLLNKFDEFDSQFKASDNQAGQAAKWVMSLNPLSEAAKQQKMLESNLTGFARASVGITSNRLMDSNKEQDRYKSLLPQLNDPSNSRANKRLDLISNTLSSIQGTLDPLSTEQKKSFWADIFKSNEKLAKLGEDPYFREKILIPTLQTGNFSPTMLNAKKRK